MHFEDTKTKHFKFKHIKKKKKHFPNFQDFMNPDTSQTLH